MSTPPTIDLTLDDYGSLAWDPLLPPSPMQSQLSTSTRPPPTSITSQASSPQTPSQDFAASTQYKFQPGERVAYILDPSQPGACEFAVVNTCHLSQGPTGAPSPHYEISSMSTLWTLAEVPEHSLRQLGPLNDDWQRPQFAVGQEVEVRSRAESSTVVLPATVLGGSWKQGEKKWRYELRVEVGQGVTVVGGGYPEEEIAVREWMLGTQGLPLGWEDMDFDTLMAQPVAAA